MVLEPTSFNWVADLVKKEAAIALEPGKEYLVESRLAPLASRAGCGNVEEYLRLLRTQVSQKQRVEIVEAMTTNETSWFRDREPFEVLSSQVLPELLRQRNEERHLNVWSAGCSSGQEAFTIAMVLQDELPPGWTFSILATDISREMLNRVDAAEYNQLEIGRGLPAHMMIRNFDRVGTQWRVKDALRKTVTTQYLNLARAFGNLPSFDLVFLRNVLIYFDVSTKTDVLRRVRSVTKPGGYLFLGAAETTLGIDDGWERITVGRSIQIRKPLTPESAALSGRTQSPTFGTR